MSLVADLFTSTYTTSIIMKSRLITMTVTAALLMTGCSKTPQDVVNDTYNAANEGKWEVLADYVLLDSVAPLTDQEKQQFKEAFYHMPEAPAYSVLDIQPSASTPPRTRLNSQ